jgi:hypothetical protein
MDLDTQHSSRSSRTSNAGVSGFPSLYTIYYAWFLQKLKLKLSQTRAKFSPAQKLPLAPPSARIANTGME